MNKLVSFVLVLGVLGQVYSTQVQQCKEGKQVENLNELVKIGTCNKPPCRLRKNHQIPIELKFTPEKDLPSLKTNVFANIVGVPFPFIGVDGSDACGLVYEADGKTKASCPLKAGTEYVYKNVIDVLEIYPRLKLVVHWALKADDGTEAVCFEVPARITN